MNRLIIALFTLLLAIGSLRVGAQVTANVFGRVLDIRVNAGTAHEGTATAFTIDVDGREYVVTARHVVQGLKESDSIDVLMNGQWLPLTFKIFRRDEPIDIAVLIPPHQLTVNFSLPFDKAGPQFGQEMYFLGFPYGISSNGLGANGHYPLALIKRGTMSGLIVLDPVKKATKVLLDGYNNPGFSGGPIIYRDFSESGYVMKVFAMVSGFMPEVVPTIKEHDINSPADAGDTAKSQPWKIQRRSNGTYFEYIDSGTFVALNTGIVFGFIIDPAIDLIREHPIGPKSVDLPWNGPTSNPQQ